jgi:hypothetical protein
MFKMILSKANYFTIVDFKLKQKRSTVLSLGWLPAITLMIICTFSLHVTAQSRIEKQWVKLFNQKDLKAWETYLIPSTASSDQTPIGLNKDPHGVFSIVDGTLRVSGQDWGGIMTKDSFSNYHLRFQVKWGTQKWAPRENVVPDGGLLFHCSLPYDFGSKCWMRSLELQIQKTDIGDYHNVGAGTPNIQVSPSKDDNDTVDQYDPFGTFKRTNSRVYRSANFESPDDAWTTGELVAHGADAVFIVNGFVVNRIFDIYRDDLRQQTSGGRIQFQSEGAEHFLRAIEIRPILMKQIGPAKLHCDEKELVFAPMERKELHIKNQGEAVELIAAELQGKNLEQWTVRLPQFPLVLQKGDMLTIPIELKEGSKDNHEVVLRMETLLGPVKDFKVGLKKAALIY